MVLINRSGAVTEDPWEYPQEGRDLLHSQHTNSERIVVRLEQWGEFESRFGASASGIWVFAEQDASSLVPLLDQVELIVVEFRASRDGRGFTLARMLRERHRFEGDIRAAGPLLPDQFAVLLQCGYTSLLASSRVPLIRWHDAAVSHDKVKTKPRTFLDRLSRQVGGQH